MHPTYNIGIILGSLVLMATIHGYFPQANPDPLANYKWEKRILLLFMPTPDHPVGSEQINLLKQASSELAARDLEVLVVAGNEMESGKLKPNAGVALRRQFEVSPAAFIMLLIGKDGGEKYRINKVEEPGNIFKIIDAMPMRQNEVKQQNRSKTN